MKHVVYLVFLFVSLVNAQDEDKEQQKLKNLQASKNYTWEANKALAEKDFVNAEADYRKAISKSSENAAAPYNLGNAYYTKETFGEAFSRFKQAGELATSKEDKHKAYHNMGNVFMKEKQYEKAVEGYKQALRNDPTDEETRYNLALAQEMLKKQQDEDKKNQDQDEEKKDDKKDEDEEKKEGDNKEDQGDDQKKEGDEGDKEDKKDKEGEGDKKEDNKKPNEGDKPQDQKEQPQQRPSQLSPQQVQNLLEAMQNEEKKVQEKMDAKKVKGVKTKNEKDW